MHPPSPRRRRRHTDDAGSAESGTHAVGRNMKQIVSVLESASVWRLGRAWTVWADVRRVRSGSELRWCRLPSRRRGSGFACSVGSLLLSSRIRSSWLVVILWSVCLSTSRGASGRRGRQTGRKAVPEREIEVGTRKRRRGEDYEERVYIAGYSRGYRICVSWVAEDKRNGEELD